MKKRVFWVHAALILVLGAVVYNNARFGDFVLDDYSLVKDNVTIRSLKSLPLVFTKQTRQIAYQRHGPYRPVSQATFMLDHAVWKMDPRGYHLTNILIHLANALCVYGLILLLLGKRALALWTSLFFVALPVHPQAVAYISGRGDLLSLLFTLLSYLFYLKTLPRGNILFFCFFLLSFCLALLSKENSFILPFLLLAYHYVFKKKIRFLPLSSVLALSGLLVFLRLTLFKASLLKTSAVTTVFQRVPGFFVAFRNYLRLLVWPTDLHVDYGRKMFSMTDPAVLSGVLVFLCFLSVLFKKRKDAPVAFGMLWFLLALLPVSNLYPLSAYMAEHWLYIPSIGFCLILACAATSLKSSDLRTPALKILFGGLLAFYSLVTIRQNEYWQEPVSFYLRTLKYSPGNPVIYTDLGIVYEERGQVRQATEAYEKAISLNPAYAKPYNNLGLIYQRLGKTKEAARLYEKAISVNPQFATAHNNLGVLYAQEGQKERAIALFNNTVSLDPGYASAFYNLGNVLSDLGRHEEAILAYKKALGLNPAHGRAYDSLGAAYRSVGRTEDAVVFYKEAIKLNPGYASPYYNLAMLYKEKGQNKEALSFFRQALEIEPKNIDIINALASLYRATGRHDKAIELYNQALEIEPANPVLYFNLGNVSLGLGRRQEAIALYKKAVRLNPGFGAALDNLAVAFFYEKKFAEALQFTDRARAAGIENAGLLEALAPYRKQEKELKGP